MEIGITGGFGTGKSTVSRMLAKRGAVIIDADLLAREAVAPGEEALEKIETEFGPDYINDRGELKRGMLAELIFSDSDARRRLNAIIHPRIFELYRLRKKDFPGEIVIFDVPLLYETGFDNQLDFVIVVHAETEVQLQRLRHRNNFSAAEAMKRIKAQMPLDEKVKKADFVIYNSSGPDNTEAQAEKLWTILKAKN